jgi:hypothetical protein
VDSISSNEDPSEIRRQQKFYALLKEEFTRLPPKTQKGWIINKNWVISTPMETGIAPREQAIRLLNTVRDKHCGEYGPYLSAVERNRMMTIATGVQAMAECSYGRTDDAMWYVDKIVQTFSRVLPGSISEMMPDYGCPAQAWTIYGLAAPLVTHVYGIHPSAYNKTITLAPNLPSGWNDISIFNLPVGNNSISFSIKKTEKEAEYNLSAQEADWKYMLKIKGLAGKKYELNGKTVTATSDEIVLSGKKNKVVVM